MKQARNFGAVWYRFIKIAAVFCLALTLSPAFANSNRVEELDQIFFDADFEMPSEACLIHILREEQQTGHTFTKEQVLETAQKYLEDHGSTLNKRRHCFTCKMRILTPSGYVAIENLKDGDAVYSWDDQKKTLVLNQVAQVFSSNNQTYGQLSNAPTGINLEVTPDHPFLVAGTGNYVKIRHVGPRLNLLAIEPHHCIPFLQPKGRYHHAGKGPVRNISVRDAPHNFIVEGYVVHNKPIF